MQIQFSFATLNSYLETDFIVSCANQEVINYLDLWPNWQGGAYPYSLSINGPTGCGKTHLAHIWQRKSAGLFLTKSDICEPNFDQLIAHSAYIIEDIEKYLSFENSLFHLFNILQEHKKFLLITSKNNLAVINFKLADLSSRLKSLLSIQIDQPDEELLRVLAIKLFSDRQIRISLEVINYLINNCEKSFAELNRIINLIDHKSLLSKRKISISFVKELIG